MILKTRPVEKPWLRPPRMMKIKSWLFLRENFNNWKTLIISRFLLHHPTHSLLYSGRGWGEKQHPYKALSDHLVHLSCESYDDRKNRFVHLLNQSKLLNHRDWSHNQYDIQTPGEERVETYKFNCFQRPRNVTCNNKSALACVLHFNVIFKISFQTAHWIGNIYFEFASLTLSSPWVPIGTYIDFTLSNARRFYSSMGNPLGRKGLRIIWKVE